MRTLFASFARNEDGDLKHRLFETCESVTVKDLGPSFYPRYWNDQGYRFKELAFLNVICPKCGGDEEGELHKQRCGNTASRSRRHVTDPWALPTL